MSHRQDTKFVTVTDSELKEKLTAAGFPEGFAGTIQFLDSSADDLLFGNLWVSSTTLSLYFLSLTLDFIVSMDGFKRNGKDSPVLTTVKDVTGENPLTIDEWAKEVAAVYQ